MHTKLQTFVGFMLGSIFGLIAVYFEGSARSSALSRVLQAPVSIDGVTPVYDKAIALGARLLISFCGFIVIFSREIKSFVSKIIQKKTKE